MLTRTGEYALRALIHLAQHEQSWPIPGKLIAQEAGIPPKYLSAVLSDLVRAGVLWSARGKSGGFGMVNSPKDTCLFDVLESFEPVLSPDRPCPFGNTMCSDDEPCLGHDAWMRVREDYYTFLRSTSIFDVAIGRNGTDPTVQISVRR